MKKLKVSGDIGAQRAAEMPGKGFKKGKTPHNPLQYRKPKIEGGQGPRAV